MAHVQYQTSVPWDSTLADLGYTSDGYVESAVKTTTGAPTATAGKFIPAAQILNKVSGITYTNTGSTASPTWTALGGGGGGIAIGDAITDADAASILYVDGSGNLAQDAGFTRDVATGVTNISATYGIDTYSYKLDDDLFGDGTVGLLQQYESTDGSNGHAGIFKQGSDLGYLVYVENTTGDRFVISGYPGECGFGVGNAGITIRPESFILSTNSITSEVNGISQSAGVITIGNLSDGNGTSIIINDLLEQITIANVPTYADDAAAILGGLIAGNLYKTTTAGITALNIVP